MNEANTTRGTPSASGADAPIPSAWVRHWAGLVPTQGAVLDVACGTGRHLRLFQTLGHPVTGVDRNPDALAAARTLSSVRMSALEPEIPGTAGVELLQADLENGPWPWVGRTFAGVVVTNYLWRPLLPAIVQSLAPGGVLIYETFAQGNEKFGKPSNPDFLLRPGELLAACAGLHVVAYEDVTLNEPPRCVQRVCAVRSTPS